MRETGARLSIACFHAANKVRLEPVGLADQPGDVAGKIDRLSQPIRVQRINPAKPWAVSVRIMIAGHRNQRPGKITRGARDTVVEYFPCPLPGAAQLIDGCFPSGRSWGLLPQSLLPSPKQSRARSRAIQGERQ